MEKSVIYKYIKKHGLLLFSIILILFGIITLTNGAENGIESAHEYLIHSMGGSMNTDSYLIMTKGYILSNIIMGAISLLVGLVFSSIVLYKSFKRLS